MNNIGAPRGTSPLRTEDMAGPSTSQPAVQRQPRGWPQPQGMIAVTTHVEGIGFNTNENIWVNSKSKQDVEASLSALHGLHFSNLTEVLLPGQILALHDLHDRGVLNDAQFDQAMRQHQALRSASLHNSPQPTASGNHANESQASGRENTRAGANAPAQVDEQIAAEGEALPRRSPLKERIRNIGRWPFDAIGAAGLMGGMTYLAARAGQEIAQHAAEPNANPEVDRARVVLTAAGAVSCAVVMSTAFQANRLAYRLRNLSIESE